jgi:hypothetical protein
MMLMIDNSNGDICLFFVLLLSDLTIQCAFKLSSGVSWIGGSAFVQNKYKDDLEALKTIVNTVVLPTGACSCT